MAEYYARYLFEKRGMRWSAASAGISALRGMPMSAGARDALTERGYADEAAVSRHVSAPADEASVAAAEFIYCMTAYHAEIMRSEFPRHAGRVFVMPEPVSDPWGGGAEDYRRCLDTIVSCVDQLVDGWTGG